MRGDETDTESWAGGLSTLWKLGGAGGDSLEDRVQRQRWTEDLEMNSQGGGVGGTEASGRGLQKGWAGEQG